MTKHEASSTEMQKWDGLTADQLDARAAEKRQRSADSWERSDTDGFLSQWASDTSARLDEMNATALRNGGKVRVPVLVDGLGSLVPARIIETRYGSKWAIFASYEDADSRTGEIVRWVGLGERALTKRGLVMGFAYVPGHYELRGESVTSVGPAPVADRLFDPKAEIITDTEG